MLRRVDAENRLQTLKEELDFQKNIYSEVGGLCGCGRGAGAALGAGRRPGPPACPVLVGVGGGRPAPRPQAKGG